MKTILALVAGLLVAYAHGEANSPSADAPRGERPGGMGGAPGSGMRGGRPPMDKKVEAYVRGVQERSRKCMEADKEKYGAQYERIAQDALSRFRRGAGMEGRPRPPIGNGPAQGPSSQWPAATPGADTNREAKSIGGTARAGKLLSTRYPGSFAERMMIATELLNACYRGEVFNVELKYLELTEDPSWKNTPTVFGFEAFPTVLAFIVTNYRAKGNAEKANEFLDTLKKDYTESYLFPPMHLRNPPIAVRDFIADPDKFGRLFKGGKRNPAKSL